VKYVLKHFPLDPECNPAAAGHFAACEAAAAYVMANPRGNSGKLESWLFANQPNLTPELVKQGAAQIGGIKDFDAQYPTALNTVREDIKLGEKLEVKSTPTFFINGRQVGGLTGQAFQAAIELELKRSR
jgi:protein-disulfide isomerase